MKEKHNIHIRVINVLFLAILWSITVTGCKFNLSTILNPPAIFSNPICNPPCWQNIYPGKTSQSEVVAILIKLDYVDHETIIVRGEPWSIFDDGIISTFEEGEIKSEIYFINDHVSLMIFSGTINMKFSQAIDNFGEPEYIINIPLSGGMPLAPTTSYWIRAINPEQGIEYSFDTRNLRGSFKKEIQPDTPLDLISFFNPDDYEKILNAGLFSSGYLIGDETRQNMKPWTGYGVILQKYPPVRIR